MKKQPSLVATNPDDDKNVCIFFLTEDNNTIPPIPEDKSLSRPQRPASIPERKKYLAVISTSTTTYKEADSCVFWNTFTDAFVERNVKNMNGTLLTLQWYIMRVKFTSVIAKKKMGLEVDIMSASNPFATVLIFNSEVYKKQLSNTTKCVVVLRY